MPTLFERIVAGDLPADIVYRDSEITAFRDIHPRAPVHILIVPNKPIPTVNDIADTDAVGELPIHQPVVERAVLDLLNERETSPALERVAA